MAQPRVASASPLLHDDEEHYRCVRRNFPGNDGEMMSTSKVRPRILVTGATGFIGGQVLRALEERGYCLRGLRRVESPRWHLEGLEVEWVIGDLDVVESLDEALSGCVGVVHCAGYSPRGGVDLSTAQRLGVQQTRNLFEACLRAKVRRVVFVSCASTLGTGVGPRDVLDETSFYTPGEVLTPYFETKYAMEAEAYRYLSLGLPVTIAIVGPVLGPGEINPRTGALVLAMLANKGVGFAGEVINIADVRDVSASLVTALEQGRGGRRYILGGTNVEVADLVHLIAEIGASTGSMRRIDSGLTLAAVRLLEKGARLVSPQIAAELGQMEERLESLTYARGLSSARSEAELAHSSRPLEQTLVASVDWFRRQG